eukprot:765137-Rhodomonas_salina.3
MLARNQSTAPQSPYSLPQNAIEFAHQKAGPAVWEHDPLKSLVVEPVGTVPVPVLSCPRAHVGARVLPQCPTSKSQSQRREETAVVCDWAGLQQTSRRSHIIEQTHHHLNEQIKASRTAHHLDKQRQHSAPSISTTSQQQQPTATRTTATTTTIPRPPPPTTTKKEEDKNQTHAHGRDTRRGSRSESPPVPLRSRPLAPPRAAAHVPTHRAPSSLRPRSRTLPGPA